MESGNRVYATPAVYIEEINPALPSIGSFPETTAIVIGCTASGAAHLLQPVVIASVQEYADLFGQAEQQVMHVELSADEQPQIQSMRVDALRFPLFYHIQLFFANGGRKCVVISTGNDHTQIGLGTTGDNPSGLLGGLQVAETVSEANLLVIPEATQLPQQDYAVLVQAMLQHCAQVPDRFALIDVYHARSLTAGTLDEHRSAVGSEHLRYGASYFPDCITSYLPQVDPANMVYTTVDNGDQQPKLLTDHPNIAAWMEDIRNWLAQQFIVLPPCAAVAGAITQVDQQRGKWQSPANVVLSAIQSPAVVLTDQQQQEFNSDPVSGKSINVIRFFQGRGTMIWGARTLQGNDPEWRYIAVQRYTRAVKAAIQQALAPFTFEPNELLIWNKIRAMTENFLLQQWKQGALQGATNRDAFYVQMGQGQTMTQEDVAQGRMILEIGLALMRPAEFIMLRFEQQAQL